MGHSRGSGVASGMTRDDSIYRPSSTCRSSMASSSTALSSISNKSSDQSRVLLQEIVQDSSKSAEIVELTGGDAQCIADLLSVFLHGDVDFRSKEGRRFFRLLKNLVKSSEVFPQCYKLRDLRCDFSQVREGGGFADIFEGEYRKRKVCVKAVRMFQKEDNSRMLQSMAKEAVLWAHLTHGNILPFYGVYIQQPSGRICIISPWMDKGDLSKYLSNFPSAPRLPLVLDIIAGLRYLHASDIVHGDLKLKNVLMSDNGHALIAEFGISHLVLSTNLSSTRFSNGSMRWMAPELLDKGCCPTLCSDMWSFGCVCYEVFTCKIPFDDYASDIQILRALVQGTCRPGDVNQFDGVSTQGRELVDKCWNYKPDSRPSCEEIYKFVVDQAGERIDLEVQDVALWKAVRGGSGMTVDHANAHRILRGIRGTHEHPHDFTPSIRPISTKPNPDLTSSYASTSSPSNSHLSSSGLPSQPEIRFSSPGLNYGGYSPPSSTPRQIFTSSTSRFPPISSAMEVNPYKLRSKDIIIAVMGLTGVGKSNFIDVLTGQIGKRSGHLLESCTTEVRASLVKDYNGTGVNLVMVDTPGFDDTSKPDTEILSMISNWLAQTYRKNIKLAGVLYLHRITDNRMGGIPLRTLHMFGKLCGDAAMSRVSLVTTMWDQVQDLRNAQNRELELKENFWKTMLVLGSKMVRFENSLKSAKAIVDEIAAEKGEREALLLQEEFVDLEKQLNETHAGRMLYDALQKLVDEQKASIDKQMEQIQNQGNPQFVEGLRKERLKIEDDLQSALEGIQELRVPLSRRILLFLFGKRGKIKPLTE